MAAIKVEGIEVNTPVTAGQKVTADMTIRVQKKEKGSFKVWVDNIEKTAPPGCTVASVLDEGKKDRLVIAENGESNAKILRPEAVLTGPVILEIINLEYTVEDERIWFKLKEKDDLYRKLGVKAELKAIK